MIENRVKRIMREGGLAIGAYTGFFPGSGMVEIIGLAGFDACFIDLEHTALSLHDVEVAVLAAERVGITPIVRPPGFDPAFILRLLDVGAQGIYVPHVSGAAGARAAVDAVRYPPVGDRGILDCGRVSQYGRLPLRQHLEESNRQVLLAVMIEDLAAVEEIEAIASTPGIDLVAVGPADLARALGVSGESDHPKLVETVGRIAEAVRKGAVARLAMPNGHPAFPRTPAELRQMGCGYTTCAPYPEVRLLRNLTEQFEQVRLNLAQ